MKALSPSLTSRSRSKHLKAYKRCLMSNLGELGVLRPITTLCLCVSLHVIVTMRQLFVAVLGALGLLIFLETACAVFPARLDAFGWSSDAIETLRSGRHLENGPRYDERQADEFLANALVHLTRQAKERAASSAFQTGAIFESLNTIRFLPVHRLVTNGIEQMLGRGSTASPWFSMPLLIADPQRPNELVHAHIRLSSGRIVRSLDLIRFDKFKTHTSNGFWLPTAIVRPYFNPINTALLRFRVVYQFPTSPALYAKAYRNDPSQASAALRQILGQKEPIWLAKINSPERQFMSSLWHRALRLPGRLIDSSFFTPAERQAWTEKELSVVLPASRSEQAPLSEPRVEPNHASSANVVEQANAPPEVSRNSKEQPVTVHHSRGDQQSGLQEMLHSLWSPEGSSASSVHPNAHLKLIPDESERRPLQRQKGSPTALYESTQLPSTRPSSKDPHFGIRKGLLKSLNEGLQLSSESPRHTQSIGGTSSSAAYPPAAPEPQTYEYDFFNSENGFVPEAPIRPRPRYPRPAQEAEQPQQIHTDHDLSYLRSLEMERGLNLDLSLASPQSGGRRIP